MNEPVAIIGYSGHGFIVAACARAAGIQLTGYCDHEEKAFNPFDIAYLGSETRYFASSPPERYFVAIGENSTRRRIDLAIGRLAQPAGPLVHPTAVVDPSASLAPLSFVSAGAIVQTLVHIERGALVNTGASIDHECTIGAFAHVCPSSTLAGGVFIGSFAVVGSNATIIPNISVGRAAIIGAGSVVLNDIPDGETWVGNPARRIRSRPDA